MVPTLLIGDTNWSEFRDPCEWLAKHTELQTAPSIDAAVELLSSPSCVPLLIVLAQSWPHQFRSAEVACLSKCAPLARFCGLLGSWCEGQNRTARSLAGAMQFYWNEWVARMAPELDRAAGADFTLWGLPRTATDEDRLLALPPVRPQANRGLLAVHSRAAEMAESLCDAAAVRGWGAIWLRSREAPRMTGIRAAIWDCSRGSIEADELAAWRATLGKPPVVALAAFARLEDWRALNAAGAVLVVSKPFWLDDLFGQLANLLEPPAQIPPVPRTQPQSS